MKRVIIVTLLVAILMQPIMASAYGGGIPPVIGPGPNIGPRLELIEKRLNERLKELEERLNNLFERINSVFSRPIRWSRQSE
jgi:hypothetical protein